MKPTTFMNIVDAAHNGDKQFPFPRPNIEIQDWSPNVNVVDQINNNYLIELFLLVTINNSNTNILQQSCGVMVGAVHVSFTGLLFVGK